MAGLGCRDEFRKGDIMRAVTRIGVIFFTMAIVGSAEAGSALADIDVQVACDGGGDEGYCRLSVSTNPPVGGGSGGGNQFVVVDGNTCFTVTKADPQPAPDSPVWGGRHPEGGIYECFYGIRGAPGVTWNETIQFWSPVALGGPSAAELAQQAVDDMHLVAPVIGMTGYGEPDSMQVLGLPTWMWVADPGESTTGPVVRSVSAGGVTVTATAQLRETVWHMGDGGVVTCSGADAAGTPYADSFDKAPSPTCGHWYARTSAGQPGKAYTVTVTANWDIRWSGGGQSGTIPMSLVRSTQLRVGEVQVIVDGSGQGQP
jgi:hypothetical protein